MDRAHSPIDHDALCTEEHVVWKRHRNWLLEIPRGDVGHRGCFGIALAVDSSHSTLWIDIDPERMLMPDRTVRWYTLIDVPPQRFAHAAGRNRETHWATVRPTSYRYGMPAITGKEDHAWDFRSIPFESAEVEFGGRKTVIRGASDVINPNTHQREFRAFNHLELAMSSFAFNHRKPWYEKRQVFAASLGLGPGVPKRTPYVIGEITMEELVLPPDWMPSVYLGFNADIGKRLFELSLAAGPNTPLFNDDMRRAFINDMMDNLAYRAAFDGKVTQSSTGQYHGLAVQVLVLEAGNGTLQTVRFSMLARIRCRVGHTFAAGDVLATDPVAIDSRYSNDPGWRWHALENLLGPQLEAFIRIWFERHTLMLRPGLIHLPAALTALASRHAVAGEAYWELSLSMPYYSADCDAFIFPPVPIRHWRAFRGSLPGAIEFDLTPNDPRYTPIVPITRREPTRQA